MDAGATAPVNTTPGPRTSGLSLAFKGYTMTTLSYSPGQDEKLVPVLIYTPQKLIWGQLIAKQMIRVSTWLQTEMASNYMDLVDAQVLLFGAGREVRSMKFPILHLETHQVIAYHLLPPADESPYYNPDTPNRKLEFVTTLVGVFRFNCNLRIAEGSDIQAYLGVKKGDFLPIFNATMTCPLLPSIKSVRTPFALIRQDRAIFCTHDAGSGQGEA